MEERTFRSRRRLRATHLHLLATRYRVEYRVLRRGFAFLDAVHARLRAAKDHADSETNRALLEVSALALAKCRRLCYGIYSLTLDGLGDESGALLRPLLEALEALHWLGDEPSRALGVVGGELPRAGERAQAAGSPFWEAKSALSEAASHFAFSQNSEEVETPDAAPAVEDLRQLLAGGLAADMLQVGVAAVGVLAAAGVQNHDLADDLEALRTDIFRVFKIVAIAGFGIPTDIPRELRYQYKYPTEMPIRRFP